MIRVAIYPVPYNLSKAKRHHDLEYKISLARSASLTGLPVSP